MTLNKLSKKQFLVFKWCHMSQTKDKYDAIICDGAIRSGKTVSMIVSFIYWAMKNFTNMNFAICGKTVQSVERNIISVMFDMSDITDFFTVKYARSSKKITIKAIDKVNYFYIFGGRDESSAALIQGMTLGGILLDEVALMPRSFVEQAIARTLSVESAKLWFNCNPESPVHWFYTEWIEKSQEKKALHVHFTMNDNPIMTPEKIRKSEALYTGVFYDRFIKGLWVQASGLIYPDQAQGANIVPTVVRNYSTYYVSCDYGTLNPFSMGLWGFCEEEKAWYRIKEYYYSGRDNGTMKTDAEYLDEYKKLTEGMKIKAVIVDPSAASFIELLKRNKVFVIKADNCVNDGIRSTATAFSEKRIMINDCCKDCIKELSLYHWDEKCPEDRPVKENDHAMDEMRYFVYTVLSKPMPKLKVKPKEF